MCLVLSTFHSDSVFLFDDLRICIYVYYISYLHSMDTFRLRLSTVAVAVRQISGSCLGEMTHPVPRILAVTLLTYNDNCPAPARLTLTTVPPTLDIPSRVCR